MLDNKPLTIKTLLATFPGSIGLTIFLTLCEAALTALVPLLMGFAIDGLLAGNSVPLMQLMAVLAGLIAVSIGRRIYDTRTYGTIRVELGKALAARSDGVEISTLNARLDMGRELADFLEGEVPEIINSLVQLIISVIVLYVFHPVLSYAALIAGLLMIASYGVSHQRFYRLNADHNQQTEQQVRILEKKSFRALGLHLNRLRQIEIRLSDTEAFVYGAIFTVLLGFIIFNLWFATTSMTITVGTIFSIISYSWEFVEAALILPITLQGWSRLSEIMNRINKTNSISR